MTNRIADYYDSTPPSDFFADAEYDVHGSAFAEVPLLTCPQCCAAVPADFQWCPLCLEPLDECGAQLPAAPVRRHSLAWEVGVRAFCYFALAVVLADLWLGMILAFEMWRNG